MKLTSLLFPLLLTQSAWAFPAAPDFSLYGVVRNEAGRPLETGAGLVIINGPAGEITRSFIDTSRGKGLNYTVHLPMDSGTTTGLYQVTAVRPLVPFTIKVTIGTRNYVPIQLKGGSMPTGKPGERVRLDLTLGEDADGDGIADSWEYALMDSDESGSLRTLTDINPGDDLDKDGLTNLEEFHLGTYALNQLDGIALETISVKNGWAHLRFVAAKGRTYAIKFSQDLNVWNEALMGLTEAGETQSYLRASSSGLVDLYVPVGEQQKTLFRLYAE